MLDWEDLATGLTQQQSSPEESTTNTGTLQLSEDSWLNLANEMFPGSEPVIENREGLGQDAGLIERAPVLPSAFKRGLIRSTDIPTGVGMMSGLVDKKTHAEQVAKTFRRLQEFPMTKKQQEGLEDIYEAEGLLNQTRALVSNPETAMMLVGESLGYYVPAMAMGTTVALASPDKATGWMRGLGIGLGFGVGSGLSETVGSLTESLVKEDINIADPVAVQKALDNPEFYEKAKKRAQIRGVSIGTFDALTASIASLPFKTALSALDKAGAPIKAKVLGASLAEAGVQAAGGVGGETVAQELTGEYDPTARFLEGALEVATSGPQALAQSILARDIPTARIKSKEDLEQKFAEEVYGPVTASGQGELFDNLINQVEPDQDVSALPKKNYTIKLKGVQPDLFDPEFDQKTSLQTVGKPEIDRLGFYSKLEQTLREKLPGKGTGPTYNDIVNAFQRKGLYAKEELEFSGLEEFLTDKTQVTKDEVLDFISKGGVGIEEKVPSASLNENYIPYTLEKKGSSNYKETLLTLPERGVKKDNFLGDHWSEPNILASIRTTDKTIDGKNTLFVEEIQSDWHQEGKEYGYKDSPEDVDVEGWYTESYNPDGEFNGLIVRDKNNRIVGVTEGNPSEEQAIQNARQEQIRSVPDAPFKNNWDELSIKRILKQASEQGYEQVSFPTGETAATIQMHDDVKKGVSNFYDGRIPQVLKKLGKKYGFSEPSKRTFTYSRNGKEDSTTSYVVSLNQKVRDKINNTGFPLYQNLDRADSLIAKVDFYPTVDWTQIRDNLYAMRMSPRIESKYRSVRNQIQELVNSVAGDKVNIDYFDTIIEKKPNTPHQYVRGAQFSNTVAISLGLNEDLGLDTLETAAHEAWHFLENSGIFNERDIKLLEDYSNSLGLRYQEDVGLTDLELAAMTISPEGREEFRAHAYGKYHAARLKKEKDFLAKIPTVIRPLFNKAYQMLTGIKRVFNRNDIDSVENLFAEAYEGRRKVSNIVDADNFARLQTLVNTFNRTIDEKENNLFDTFEDIDTAVKNTDVFGQMSGFAKVLGSPSFLARSNPLVAKGVNLVRDKIKLSNKYLSKYQRMLRDFDNSPREVRYRIYDLLDFMRQTNQSVELDEAGRLHYVRDGVEKVFTDPNTSKLVFDLNQAYQEVYNDALEGLRMTVRRAFRSLGTNFTQQDLIDLRNAENEEQVNSFIEQLNFFDNQKGKAYVPWARFGEWGVVVKDLKNKDTNGKPKTAAFYQIEKGNFKGKYNKFQLSEVQKELKEKYDDSTRYRILGKDGKPLGDVNDLGSYNLFVVNSNEKLESVDKDLSTIDGLFSLYGNQNKELFTDMRDKLVQAKETRGFKTRFTQSRDIPGYSKDWDRVHASYFHGASNYFANLEFLPRLTYFENSLKKLPKSDYSRQWAEKYLDYMKNPNEDWARTKMFNFLWALGWNPATAILQTASLYTHGLGYVTSLTGSPLNAFNKANKWFNLSSMFVVDGFKAREGSVDIDFNNNKSWDKALKSKKLSKEAGEGLRDLVKKLDDENILGGVLTAEHIGLQMFETRSGMGQAKRSLNKLQSSSGIMISITEQQTRLAILGSIFESLYGNPRAMVRGRNLLINDLNYQELRNNHPELSEEQAMATYLMERAVAVFGKEGRPEYLRGIGGALPFAFMTYPHQMWENMAQLATTKEGRQGLMATIGAYLVIGGLIGLPGGEFLKEMYEKLYELTNGEEIDLDLNIREKMYSATGEPRVGLTMTQGVLRGLLNTDTARRTGLPIPGQELVFLLTGIRTGEAGDMLGVPGSAITGIGRAYESIRTDSSIVGALGQALPNSVANVVKAASYNEGIATRSGTGLLGPEDVTTWDQASRIFGFTSGNIANMRERVFYEMVLERQHRPAYERFRKRAKNAMSRYLAAAERGEETKASEAYSKYQEILNELSEWAYEREYPLDIKSFTTSVTDTAVQRQEPKRTSLKGVSKGAKDSVAKLEGVLGIGE